MLTTELRNPICPVILQWLCKINLVTNSENGENVCHLDYSSERQIAYIFLFNGNFLILN